MKRILKTITAILLTVIMLSGCAAPAGRFRGTIKNNVYTSESAELTFTAPDGWKYSDNSMHDWSPDTPADMFASDAGIGSYVMIAYEDLAATGKTDCDEEAYFDLFKEDVINNSPGINREFSDYTETKIGRNTFKVMSISDPDYGPTYCYYIRREGNCMICIFVFILKGDDKDSIMANFS